MINRRAFLNRAAIAAVVPVLPLAAQNASDSSSAKMVRVGCTSVCFRQHFAATRKPNSPAVPEYSLLDLPAMMADRLGVHNVEVWNSHLAEQTSAYAEKLGAAAAKCGARIVNIQLDGPEYDLSHADPVARKRSIDYVKRWIDLAHACGASSLRPNTGGAGQAAPPFDLASTGESIRRLAEYGEKVGVKILIENHGGYSSNVQNVLALLDYAGDNCASLPDFGNFADASEEERSRQLALVFPKAHLVSAKGMYFDEQKRHITYDFDACMRVGEASGFRGIYSAEFWTPTIQPIDPWEAAQLIIGMIRRNI